MKRLEEPPTFDAIVDSIKHDKAGRNMDVVSLVRVIDDIEGPFSLLIDSPWGDGKTYLIKSAELTLRMLNENIMASKYLKKELRSYISDLGSLQHKYLPFYFNAWEYDTFDDPLSILFAVMAKEFRASDNDKEHSVSEKILGVVDFAIQAAQAAFNVSGDLRVGEAVKLLTGQSLIEQVKKREALIQAIKKLADDSIKEVADKLVIFIDELDRCRPDFAVRLLEQTKSMFQSDNIILVISTDSIQLAKAVGGAYGTGFDTPHFLERFFDERLLLTPIDSYAFVNKTGIRGNSVFDRLSSEIKGSYPLTIRDCMRLRKLEQARTYFTNLYKKDKAAALMSCAILPALIFLQRDDMERFRRIVTGADLDALYEYGIQFPTYSGIINDAIREVYAGDGIPLAILSSEENCKKFMRSLCAVIYSPNDLDLSNKMIIQIRRHEDYFKSSIFVKLDFTPPQTESIVRGARGKLRS